MVLRVVLSNIRKNIILAPDSFWHQVTGSKLLKEPHGWAGCHTQEKEARKILACVARLRRTRELAQMQALRKTVPEAGLWYVEATQAHSLVLTCSSRGTPEIRRSRQFNY